MEANEQRVIDCGVAMMLAACDSDEKVVREVFSARAYERPRLGFKLLRGDRLLDCGAHIGSTTVWAEKARGCVCLGVESSARNFRQAQANLLLNGCESRIVRGAVSVDHGTSYMHFNERTPSRSSCSATNGTREAVENIPFRDLVAEFSPSVIKLDIEGGEFALLDAGIEVAGARAVLMEYHFRLDRSTAKARARIAALSDHFAHRSVHSFVYREDEWRGWMDSTMLFWN